MRDYGSLLFAIVFCGVSLHAQSGLQAKGALTNVAEIPVNRTTNLVGVGIDTWQPGLSPRQVVEILIGAKNSADAGRDNAGRFRELNFKAPGLQQETPRYVSPAVLSEAVVK